MFLKHMYMMITCLLQNNGISFEFILNGTLKDNFIHPDTLYYWMIEPPVVSDWNAPFDLDLSSGENKPTFPCKGIERVSRELVKCNDGNFRTCAKVTIKVSCNDKPYDVEFYVDKTLQHAGTIGSDLGNIIKRNE